jgi:hypothetical protein
MSAGGKFLMGFVGGIAGLVLALGVLFVGLDQTGRLKAPAFANRLSFDEKLRLWQRHPLDHVDVLLVGSSTTLHGIDGAVLRSELDLEGEVANLGVQDLRINQSRFMANVFLNDHPEIQQVLMISTMLDFKNCRDTEPEFFNPDHVLDYLHGGWFASLFYQFKYLDLRGVIKRAGSIDYLRGTREELESVSFDRYGSLLLTVPRERINDRVWFGDPITLDPACYRSLRGLAEDLRTRELPFTYVIAPMRPGYLAGRDPNGALLAEHRQLLREHLQGSGTMVIDAHAALAMPDEAFFDAYHLNRDDAEVLTRYVGEQLILLADKGNADRPVTTSMWSAAGSTRAMAGPIPAAAAPGADGGG